jgi:N2-acetyl-L-2,4-diaminobutanoate deacetylase
MTGSIGFTDIDFGRLGKQVGFLNLPSSVHDDAWGVVRIPLAVIANGSGPTVILQGGNHGDEYEGPIVLGELVRDLAPERVNGRLIIVPAVNAPAVEAARRVSPLDGLNFNRTFPGNPLGSITEQLSAYVNDVLFPLADAFIDLHSGGSSLSIIPSAIVEPSEDAGLAARIRAAVLAFGAPMMVVISNFGDPRTSTASAVRAGLVTVGTEMAGMGTVSPEAVRICRTGVRNVLTHLGVFEGAVEPGSGADDDTIYAIAGTHSYVTATRPGVFEAYQQLGETVRAGQPAGRIHCPTDPQRAPEELVHGADGIVYGKRHPGWVKPGNCCMVVASPNQDQS